MGRKAKAKDSKMIPFLRPTEGARLVPATPSGMNRRYSFQTKVRCNRCGSLQTVAYSTQGTVQYRRCLISICRWKFKVLGTLV